MKEYRRKEPLFSLCGLNCALCPRFHTDGSSRCPGCGGPAFSIQHPTCAVVTCNGKHDNVEFCFDCSAFPCKKYQEPSPVDSFISYRSVLPDMAQAKADLPRYLEGLRGKKDLLEDLINNDNDGKAKGFYCLAVNLLPLPELEETVRSVKETPGFESLDIREKAKTMTTHIKERAAALQIECVLRKKP